MKSFCERSTDLRARDCTDCFPTCALSQCIHTCAQLCYQEYRLFTEVSFNANSQRNFLCVSSFLMGLGIRVVIILVNPKHTKEIGDLHYWGCIHTHAAGILDVVSYIDLLISPSNKTSPCHSHTHHAI